VKSGAKEKTTRLFVLFTLILLLLVCLPVPTRAAPYLQGDANEDGIVTASDAAAILRHLVRLTELTPQGLANAKVTEGPGPVSAADAARILRWLVRLEAEL